MRGFRWRRMGLVGLVGLGTAWGAVSWVEASREIDALCAMMTPGTTVDRVVAQLETGVYLRYRTYAENRTQAEEQDGESRANVDSVYFDSAYNAWTNACRVHLASGVVVSRVYTGRVWVNR